MHRLYRNAVKLNMSALPCQLAGVKTAAPCLCNGRATTNNGTAESTSNKSNSRRGDLHSGHMAVRLRRVFNDHEPLQAQLSFRSDTACKLLGMMDLKTYTRPDGISNVRCTVNHAVWMESRKTRNHRTSHSCTHKHAHTLLTA